MNKTFGVIGGDRRQAELARLLAGDVNSQPVKLGLRPEHLSLTEEDDAVYAAVDVSEMMGSAIHIHVAACGREAVIVVPVSEEAAERGEDVISTGTPVRFTFRGSAAHVFDPETGRNLEYPVREEPEECAPESGPPAREETEGFPPPPEDVGDPFTE